MTIANFIFLNKMCFNGLYRENSKGKFNVPSAGKKTAKIFEENNLITSEKVLILNN